MYNTRVLCMLYAMMQYERDCGFVHKGKRRELDRNSATNSEVCAISVREEHAHETKCVSEIEC